jgi:Spy/CpxP family protein refolding chaperone
MFKKRFCGCMSLLFAFFSAVSAYSQTAPTTSSASESVNLTGSAHQIDDLAGLTFTDGQKTEMGQIRQEIKPLMDNVVKDEKLTPEQKGAMLDGYRRLEQRQIFAVLTPEQQIEVRKKISARRTAEQEKRKQ